MDLEEPEEIKDASSVDDAETAASETGEGGTTTTVAESVIQDEGATIYDVIQAAENAAAPADQETAEE